ncbi:MAG: hypothetical protein WBV55_07605 [Candidatus Sulfotelmatobacter sp.]
MDNKENQIRELYAKYQSADGQAQASNAVRREAGLALGKALFDLRAEAEVVSGGTTFDSTLKTLCVPHRTAYRWIKKYELSIGIRRRVEMDLGYGKEAIEGIYFEPKDPLSVHARKAAIHLCADARRMSTKDINLLQSPAKAKSIAQGCKDREQLDLLVRDLKEVKRSLDRCLPVIEAVLAATPTEEEPAKNMARVRSILAAEQSGEDVTIPTWDDNITQDMIQ